MLMTVEELRRYMETDEDDQVLEARLQALESLIRGYTHHDFAVRHTARLADIVGGTFMPDESLDIEPGDTVRVSGERNEGLYTVVEASEGAFTVAGKTYDELDAFVVKVAYPMDVKLGAVGLLKWDLTGRDKAGVQSESISRHSVTYADQTAENTAAGYPSALMGFLQPYMCARFGRGVKL